jgi:16S rRNA pseudouridine516 synthase
MSSKNKKLIPLEKILFSQGFGTRRYCSHLIMAELVQVNGEIINDPDTLISTQSLNLSVEGQVWPFYEKAYIAFHKPPNYECSHKTKHHPSVYNLLPAPLIERGIQCVGRLDQDTTGLLLLSDDGQFIHQMTTPKKNIGKAYEITTAQPITPNQIERLLKGVVLDDDPTPCLAIHCIREGERKIVMTIVEGRYHQVKRMLVAAGNHVEKLHRRSIGNFHLPINLKEGQWQWLSSENINELYDRTSNPLSDTV